MSDLCRMTLTFVIVVLIEDNYCITCHICITKQKYFTCWEASPRVGVPAWRRTLRIITQLGLHWKNSSLCAKRRRPRVEALILWLRAAGNAPGSALSPQGFPFAGIATMLQRTKIAKNHRTNEDCPSRRPFIHPQASHSARSCFRRGP